MVEAKLVTNQEFELARLQRDFNSAAFAFIEAARAAHQAFDRLSDAHEALAAAGFMHAYDSIEMPVIAHTVLVTSYLLDRLERSVAAVAGWDMRTCPADIKSLSTRVRNCLINAGIRSLGDLAKWSEEDLLRIDNFGRRSVAEIKDLLAELGMRLRGSPA